MIVPEPPGSTPGSSPARGVTITIDRDRLEFLAELYFGADFTHRHRQAVASVSDQAVLRGNWILFEDGYGLSQGHVGTAPLTRRFPQNYHDASRIPYKMRSLLTMTFSELGGPLYLDDVLAKGWAYRFLMFGKFIGGVTRSESMGSPEALTASGYV